jgi:hypothetical protein
MRFGIPSHGLATLHAAFHDGTRQLKPQADDDGEAAAALIA